MAATDRTIVAVITDDPLPFDFPTIPRSKIEQIGSSVLAQ